MPGSAPPNLQQEATGTNDNKIVTPNIASQNIQNQPPFSSSPAPAQNQTLNANNIQNSIPDINLEKNSAGIEKNPQKKEDSSQLKKKFGGGLSMP